MPALIDPNRRYSLRRLTDGNSPVRIHPGYAKSGNMMDAAVFGQSHARVHTILVVDDEVLIRLYLAEELRHAGFTVSEASTADEARTILAAGMNVDLVLTDIRMPGSIDGVALADWIRSNFPNTKICFVSANVGPEVASLADATFAKPFQLDELLRRVQQLLTQAEQSSSAKV